MNAFDKISAAREILQLPESATMADIKSNYRKLLAKWHPDTCQAHLEECGERTRKIVDAYKTIMDYCSTYQYSFSEDIVKRNQSPEDWWYERFEDGPLWGNGRGGK